MCSNCPPSSLCVGSYCTHSEEKLSTDRVLAHCERSPRPQSVSHATDRDTADTERATLPDRGRGCARSVGEDPAGHPFSPDYQGGVRRCYYGRVALHPGPGDYVGLAAAHNRHWCDSVAATRCRGRA